MWYGSILEEKLILFIKATMGFSSRSVAPLQLHESPHTGIVIVERCGVRNGIDIGDRNGAVVCTS
jgi:hypothetical protein